MVARSDVWSWAMVVVQLFGVIPSNVHSSIGLAPNWVVKFGPNMVSQVCASHCSLGACVAIASKTGTSKHVGDVLVLQCALFDG